MKFFCNREELTRNLHIAQRATDPKSNVTVLRNVLFTVKDSTLEIVGYDHRIGVRAKMNCTADETGAVTCPAAILLEVLGIMSDETVYFTLGKGDVMSVECGKSKYQFHCITSDDFPPFPEIGPEDNIELGADLLTKGIRQTLFASNPDDPRVFMGGVMLNIEKAKIEFVATDGHRLALRRFDNPGISGARKAVIPHRTLAELLRILPADAKPIKIGMTKTSASFEFDNIYMVSRLIEAEFPKYERVVPATHQGTCRAARLKMIGAAKGAAIMARAKENKDLIEVEVVDDAMRFSASTQDVGSAQEEIEAVKKGKDIKAAFNSRYLLDFLAAVEDDEVIFEFTEELNPGLFHTDSPDYLYVLMPIKV